MMRFSAWYSILSIVVAVFALPITGYAQSVVGNVLLQAEGELEAGDATLDDGGLYDSYSFEGQAGQAVVVTATSDEFDTYLRLQDSNGKTLVENDDWNEATNSTISHVLPATGTYQIWVSAYNSTEQGTYYFSISSTDSEELFQQVLKIDDHYERRVTLNDFGLIYYRLGEYITSLKYQKEALAISLEIDSRYGEGVALNNIGLVYDSLSEYTTALQYYDRALAIHQEIDERREEGVTLNNIGVVYDALGEYATALQYYDRALAIHQEIDDRHEEVTTLNNIGLVYDDLGEYTTALQYHSRALSISQEIGYRRGEADSLHGIGLAYAKTNEYTTALQYYRQSLSISQEIDYRFREGYTLNNIGRVYDGLGEYTTALQYYKQSLVIDRELGDLSGEGYSLHNIGRVYDGLDEHTTALQYYEQALAIRQKIGYRREEGTTLTNIGYTLESLDYSALAIIYLKQAINTYEKIRTNNQTLSQESQQAFTEEVADSYRKLADLLLQQDRILEAQRVLDLLKVQELDDYLQGVRSETTTVSGIDLRPDEAKFFANRGNILARAIPIATELQDLRKTPFPRRTEKQNARIQLLETQQSDILAQFLNFIASDDVQQLIAQLSRTATNPNQDILTELNQFPTLRDNLRNIGNAVLLYPLILEDRLELVLVTADGPPTRHPVPISRNQLTTKISDFQQLLRDKNSNPEPLAQELYNLLIKPIETALTAAEAETIIYAPDGLLRYIPLAALHDGTKWLAQRYEVNHITAASLTDLNLKPSREPIVLAGAFQTGQHDIAVGDQTFRFKGLPFAGIEVDLLQESFPTTSFYDADFSRADTEPLMNDHTIVHLATHASLLIGDPSESFILFGNGERLTLEELKGWRGRLQTVDLMVLSACETGTGGSIKDSTGEEILGFGYLMQDAGARAVLSSLWPVSDGGTQELMTNFYEALKVDGMSKAEALQQAQIALITGNQIDAGSGERFSLRPHNPESSDALSNNSFSHPYYWAPFILIGNGL